jgi:peroxiredoxin
MLKTLMVVAAVLAAPAFAAIPAVGEKAPALAAVDAMGKPQSLASVQGQNGTVLMFFRSAAWCPYCKAQLIAMNEKAAAAIKARGYALVGLSYDAPEVLAKFAAERRVGWTLLSDPKSKVIDGWQLRDPAYGPESKASGVPRPVVYVIDNKGLITARLMEADYKLRPQPEAVLAAVPN